MIKRNIRNVLMIVGGVGLGYFVVYPQGKALVARMGQDLSVFVLSIILIGVMGACAALWYRWQEGD